MTCISPPELNDDQISDLLDGNAAANIQAHLAQCAYCHARFEQARQFEQHLHHRLYRWNCPDADMLQDYAFDLLTENARRQVAAHLEKCPYCRAELRQLNEFLGKEATIETTPARPTRALHRSRPNVWRPQAIQGLPVFAMRGRDTPETIMLEAKDLTVFLEAQPEDNNLWLSGRLVSADIDEWNGALVEVWQGNNLQAAASVKDGSFHCRLRNMEPVDIRISPKSGASLLIDQIKFADEPPE